VAGAGGGQVEPRNEHKCSFRGCGNHRDDHNPKIEHEHAQFWGCEVARQKEGPEMSADAHFGGGGGGGRQKVGKTPKTSGRARFQGWGHCETQRVGKVYIKRGNPKKAIIKVVM